MIEQELLNEEQTPTMDAIRLVHQMVKEIRPTLINMRDWQGHPASRVGLAAIGRYHVDLANEEWVTPDKEITAWLNILKQGKWCTAQDPEFLVHLARLVPFDTYTSVVNYLNSQKEQAE